jgi:hypothetical protein
MPECRRAPRNSARFRPIAGTPIAKRTGIDSQEVVMGDDLVVLWRDREAAHDICYEIRQIAEGEFELRILCDGRVWMTEEAVDFNDLVARATQLRRDLHPVA